MTVSNDAIAQYLEVDKDQIVGRRDLESRVIVLVNYGIGGIKKLHLSFDDLTQPPPAVVDDPPGDLSDLLKTELVEMAKEQEVEGYSTMTKAELIEALSEDE